MSDESKQSTEPAIPLLPTSEQVQGGQPPKRESSSYETATQIAEQLGESAEGARKQIVGIVAALGRTQARALLSETLESEERGGRMLPHGSRHRTLGVIGFSLVYCKRP